MSLLEVVFLAFILAVDAFLVSFSYGLCDLRNTRKSALLLALGTGAFQFLMPVLGACMTIFVYNYVQDFANYIAGIIFIILGIKIFLESKKQSVECKNEGMELTNKTIFSASVATSIDALAAGSSMYMLKTPILISAVIIGFVTFFLSVTGFYLGHSVKKIAPAVICQLAGAILVIIGFKTIF